MALSNYFAVLKQRTYFIVGCKAHTSTTNVSNSALRPNLRVYLHPPESETVPL